MRNILNLIIRTFLILSLVMSSATLPASGDTRQPPLPSPTQFQTEALMLPIAFEPKLLQHIVTCRTIASEIARGAMLKRRSSISILRRSPLTLLIVGVTAGLAFYSWLPTGIFVVGTVLGGFTPPAQHLDLKRDVQATIDQWYPRVKEKSIKLIIRLPGNPLLIDNSEGRRRYWEWSTKTLRHELFSELILNAIKYTPNGGTIRISLYRQGNEAIFQVQDSGIGIDKSEIDRIWERGYRSAAARGIRNEWGDGQGLDEAKAVVEDYGGWIAVESPGPNMGTLFTAGIPIDGSSPHPPDHPVMGASQILPKPATRQFSVISVLRSA